MGETIMLTLAVRRVGRRSISIDIVGSSLTAKRAFSAKQVLVTTSLETRRIDRHSRTTSRTRARVRFAPACRRHHTRNTHHETSSSSPGWAKPRGYANGVAARGTQVFIAGQIGWDEQARFHTSDFAAQAKQALQNIVAVLHEAGGKPEHLVRLTWYVTDKREYLAALKDIGRAFRELIGDYDIAMSAVQVVALIEDEAKVEIEATAVIPRLKQKPSITHYPVHRFPEVLWNPRHTSIRSRATICRRRNSGRCSCSTTPMSPIRRA